MENTNNTPQETAPVASAPTAAPVQASTPAPAPVEALVPAKDLAGSVSGTSTPKASPSTGDLGAGAPKGEMPKTDGKTPGGWNRFAGYNPNAAKNNKNDRREGSKGRR